MLPLSFLRTPTSDLPSPTMSNPPDTGFDLRRAATRVLLFQAIALLGLWLLQSRYGAG